jgi:ribonuclease P protein component
MAVFTLKKKERLKSKALWDEVFSSGKQIKVFPLLLYYIKSPLSEDVRFQVGFAVPKKKIRKAVKRNRIKRLIREVYRIEKHGITRFSDASYALVFLYLGKEEPHYSDLLKNMQTLMKKWVAHETEQNA